MTSALIFCGFLGALLGPLFILLLPDLGRHRTLSAMFARLAQKGLGRLEERSDGQVPVPVFTLAQHGRGLVVTPDLPHDDEHPGALLFGVPGPFAMRLEVHPRQPAPRAELDGLAEVAFTDALTARAYTLRIAGDWPRLAPRVEPALERLAQLGDKPAFALSVTPERLQLRRLAPPAREDELEALIVRAGELIDAVVAGAGAEVAGAAACHQCGQALGDSECRCRRCKTSYHRACFDRTGGCTQYPCTCTTAVS